MSEDFVHQTAAHELAEEGYPLPSPRVRGDGLPPGGGKLTVPHYATFSQIVNMVARTYRWTFDEALRSSHVNALAMRRDAVVMDALRARQLPTVQLSWHLEPRDDTNQLHVEAADNLTKIIQRIPRWQTYLMHLMEALWYGRYAVQNVYRWDWSEGRRQLVIADYKPINGDKLVFRYSGQVGVLVHPTFFRGETEFTDRGRAHFFTSEERETVVIHKHEPEDVDFFEAELAGGIHGVGIRSRLYWFWWLKSQVLAFLMDYLERVGAGGFTVYYYESGNDESLKEVKAAAEEQWRNNAILFPRYRDGTTGGPGIQRIEPGQAGAQLLTTLVTSYFDDVTRRYILGQSLTSQAGATGLGSGVADLHGETFGRIVKFDAQNLAETLTQDLVAVLCRYNYPGVPAPRFLFDVDKPNAVEVLEAARAFYEMGGAIDEDELRGVIGLAKPEPGHTVLAKVPSISPAGVGAMPAGVPAEGVPGPLPEGGGPAPSAPEAVTTEAQGQPYLFAVTGEKVRLEADRGGLQSYVRDGMLDLYHYTPSGEEELELDPERLGQNPWSQRERKSASTPRTFFYLDPSHVEPFFEGRPLYKTTVPASSIYDLATDPDELVPHVVRTKGYPLSVDDVLDEVKARGFQGVHYVAGGTGPVVALFNKTKVRRVQPVQYAAKKPKIVKPPKSPAGIAWNESMGSMTPSEGSRPVTPEARHGLLDIYANQAIPEPAVTGSPEFEDAGRRYRVEPPPADLRNDPRAWLLPHEQELYDLAPAPTKKAFEKALAGRRTPEYYANVAWAGRALRHWYAHSNQALRTLFPDEEDRKRFAFLAAALSPVNPVETSLATTLDVWRAWDAAGRPQDPKEIRQLLYRLEEGLIPGLSAGPEHVQTPEGPQKIYPKPTTGTYLKNIIRVLSHKGDWTRLLKGLKVSSFAPNLLGDPRFVTADTHLARAEGVSQKEFQQLGPYLASVVRARQAAALLNEDPVRGAEHWTPEQVQAAMWAVSKAIADRIPPGDVKPGAARKAFERLTHGKLADLGDFGSLLRSPRLSARLRAMGMGAQLDAALKHLDERTRHGGRVYHTKEFRASPLLPKDKSGQTIYDQDWEPFFSRLEALLQKSREENRKKQERREQRERRRAEGLDPFRSLQEWAKTAKHAPLTGGVHLSARDVDWLLGAGPIRYEAEEEVAPTAPPVTGPTEPAIEAGEEDPWVFFSPNTDENLSFEQAYGRLRSTNQKAFRDMSHDIIQAAGVSKYQVHDAVGDWSDGAENSILAVLHDAPDPSKSLYIAAWKGLLANQKSVLHFQSSEEGPDSVYQVYVDEPSASRVRKSLDHSGIAFRTIIPQGRGHIVVVYDEGRALRPNILNFAREHSATVRETHGRGQFLGGATRSAARRAYREIIRNYESSGGRAEGGEGPGAGDVTDPSASPFPRSLFQLAAKGKPVKTRRRAPPGGMVWRGVFYKGGEFIPAKPGEVVSERPRRYAALSDRDEHLETIDGVSRAVPEFGKWVDSQKQYTHDQQIPDEYLPALASLARTVGDHPGLAARLTKENPDLDQAEEYHQSRLQWHIDRPRQVTVKDPVAFSRTFIYPQGRPARDRLDLPPVPKDKVEVTPYKGQFIYFKGPDGQVFHVARVRDVEDDGQNYRVSLNLRHSDRHTPEESAAYSLGYDRMHDIASRSYGHLSDEELKARHASASIPKIKDNIAREMKQREALRDAGKGALLLYRLGAADREKARPYGASAPAVTVPSDHVQRWAEHAWDMHAPDVEKWLQQSSHAGLLNHSSRQIRPGLYANPFVVHALESAHDSWQRHHHDDPDRDPASLWDHIKAALEKEFPEGGDPIDVVDRLLKDPEPGSAASWIDPNDPAVLSMRKDREWVEKHLPLENVPPVLKKLGLLYKDDPGAAYDRVTDIMKTAKDPNERRDILAWAETLPQAAKIRFIGWTPRGVMLVVRQLAKMQ